METKYNLIGVCLSMVQSQDRFRYIQSLNRAAVAQGYRLMIFNSSTDMLDSKDPVGDEGELSLYQLIPYDMLSAMVVFPCYLNDRPIVYEVISNCQKMGIPVLTIDKTVAGCTCFAFAYADIFEQLCNHVLEEHHVTKVLMMAGIHTAPDSDDRVAYSDERVVAFQKALRSHGIPFTDDMVGYGDFWEGPATDTMVRWFEQEKREIPEAIICANDAMGIAVSTYLQKHGIRVPEDCIVTGFDGIIHASYQIPHLTTCIPDYDKMGEAIVSAINKRRAGAIYPAFNTVSAKIIRSQSCGCEEISFEHVNDAFQEIFHRLLCSQSRQDLMCSLQTAVARMDNAREITYIMSYQYGFHSACVAINSDFYDPETSQKRLQSGQQFTDEVEVLYHRYFWRDGEPCHLSRHKLVPEINALLDREDPLIISAIHFREEIMGYCVFQMDINIDEYEKLQTFMSALNASLGAFQIRLQVQAANRKLKAANDELDQLYVHDQLTGLLNRRGFYRDFYAQIRSNRGMPVTAVFVSVDLDGLKTINDNYGHLEGDNAIVTVACGLQQCAGSNDISARFGGDEFAVAAVIPMNQEQAYFADYRKRLDDFLAAYNETSDKEYMVEASLGFYAQSLTADFDLDDLIKRADDQMYQEKHERKKARLRPANGG